ncbi:MAG: Pyruvate synthase subunit PorD [Methanoregula sp. PtaU1.Bin051]|nr:MAG: Pyruvate synthase subunit PorD [Methanoregula sp. PtaU1.Bin051]
MALAVGCRARPGKSRDNKTGSWRVFRPVFDNEKCSKCGLCQTVCPEGCIHETDEEFMEPDYTYCKGCGLCAEECPGGAIEMKQEEK